MRTAAALLILATLVRAATAEGGGPRLVAGASAPTPRLEVRGARIHATDLLGPSAPELDLGPTPPVGSTRLIERVEIERAYEAASVAAPKSIPTALRVSRKTRKLDATEVTAAIRLAVAEKTLPKSAELSAVRATATEVPADFERVAIDLPVFPRRAGSVKVQAPVRFLGEGGATLQKTVVPLEFTLPPEAAFADVVKGAPMSLTLRRGLVEVTVTGVATADADVGSILGFMIKPSGRVIRGRVVDKTHALALEDS